MLFRSRMEHPVGDFIDGAITTGGNDEIAAGIDLMACLHGGAARAESGNEAYLNSLLGENASATLKQVPAARQPARDRIINDGCAFRAG